MCHIWPDLVVRGAGGTAVVRTHQLIKDARPIHVLAYSGKYRPGKRENLPTPSGSDRRKVRSGWVGFTLGRVARKVSELGSGVCVHGQRRVVHRYVVCQYTLGC